MNVVEAKALHEMPLLNFLHLQLFLVHIVVQIIN